MRLFTYTVSILLMMFYVAMLGIALNPSVSEYYKGYYIDKSIDMPPSLWKRFTSMQLGVTYYPDDNSIGFLKGWSVSEKSHIWSSSSSATIMLELESNVNILGIMDISHISTGDQRVGISINGNEVFTGTFQSEHSTTNIIFDPSIIGIGLNYIEFSLPDATQVPPDTRSLAIGLVSLKIR